MSLGKVIIECYGWGFKQFTIHINICFVISGFIGIVDTQYAKCACADGKITKVEYGKNLLLKGVPIIFNKGGAKLKIGENVTIKSSFLSNLVGLYSRTIIVTRAPGAEIEIGDNVGISGATIYARKKITIGENTCIGGNCKILDNDFHPIEAETRNKLLRDENGGDSDLVPSREIKIGKNCFIGCNSIILKGTVLGDGCVVGAGAVVAGKFEAKSFIASLNQLLFIPSRLLYSFKISSVYFLTDTFLVRFFSRFSRPLAPMAFSSSLPALSINQRSVTVSRKRMELAAVKEYLDEHYTERITLDDLAERFFINKFYLSKIFKETYGTTVNNYLISKRITRAKQLLRFTDMTVDEVGAAVGMGDANYFSRMFRKVEGISPREYRKQW